MNFHPIASVFPLLQGDDLEALADDIRQHGQLEDIVLYEGQVLDGRNRWTACTLAGKTPRTREFTGTRMEALTFVWSENMKRRHLTPSQAAVAEIKREKLHAEYAAEVEKMKAEAKAKQAHGKTAPGKTLSQTFGQALDPHERRTDAQRAKAAGTNRSYLEQVRKIEKVAPEELDVIERGEKSVRQVYLEVAGKKSPTRRASESGPDWKSKTISRTWYEKLTTTGRKLDGLTNQSGMKYSKFEVRRAVDELLTLIAKLA